MLTGPVQIAYAVPDVVAAATAWVADGVGPFYVIEHIDVRNVRIHGSPNTFDHSSAYAQWGSLMVELICQHDVRQHDGGNEPDSEPVVGVSGLHHMASFVDDFASTHHGLVERGYPEVLYAETGNGTAFGFHDARAERGHFIEIYERTSSLARFYDMVRAAAVDWNGTDPIRRL